jgi:hypothetical protein
VARHSSKTAISTNSDIKNLRPASGHFEEPSLKWKSSVNDMQMSSVAEKFPAKEVEVQKQAIPQFVQWIPINLLFPIGAIC